MIYDLNNDKYIEKKESKSLRFLYNTFIGRIILKIATKKFVANLVAKYMNSKLSIHKIKSFIKKNNIDMEEYEEKKYRSFNEFFIRNIKKGKRNINDGIVAVSDSKLSIYKINKESRFEIKNSIYTVEELIREKKEYKYALVFRLSADDYHHYIFPDNGKIIRSKHINGILHTVQPIAFKKYKVFSENDREITFLKCDNLGDVCFIEVGAMIIGKIVNEDKMTFKKGEEKGHFEFGGSTIIVLLNKNIKFNDKILDNSKKNIETIVKMGEQIGKY
jgi:phosphatidylserine decarboxylase